MNGPCVSLNNLCLWMNWSAPSKVIWCVFRLVGVYCPFNAITAAMIISVMNDICNLRPFCLLWSGRWLLLMLKLWFSLLIPPHSVVFQWWPPAFCCPVFGKLLGILFSTLYFLCCDPKSDMKGQISDLLGPRPRPDGERMIAFQSHCWFTFTALHFATDYIIFSFKMFI